MNTKATKESKQSTFEKCKDILDVIYYLCNGMILHKQLICLLSSMNFDSNINNQKQITLLIKEGVLVKKQVLLSKSNMLIMSSLAISQYTGQNTRDITPIACSDKTIQNRILQAELLIQKYIPAMMNAANKSSLTVLDIQDSLEASCSSLNMTAKNTVEYYTLLDQKFPGNFTSDFYDDIACQIVEKANQVNKFAKFKKLDIPQAYQKIKNDLDFIKATMNDSTRSRSFYNINNLLSSSMTIEYVIKREHGIKICLAIYDNGNLSVERVSTLSAYVYQMYDRYFTSETPFTILVNVYTFDDSLAEELKTMSTQRAEDLYGYSKNTRQMEYLLHSGMRFPSVEDSISFKYKSLKIFEHYKICSK